LFVSILIIGISLTLFLYWFRYTCVLILSTRTSRDYTAQIATANQLTFLETQTNLLEEEETETTSFAKIHQCLDRDYKLLTYLLQHGSSQGEERSLENRILMVDFRIMSLWYGMVQHVSRAQARNALLEMTSIVSHLANTMGERVSVRSST
jgi:hypothetical protein